MHKISDYIPIVSRNEYILCEKGIHITKLAVSQAEDSLELNLD